MRKFLLLIITAVLLLPGVAQAQSDSSCGTLAAADCTILTASQTAMAGLKSANFNLRFTLHTANLPEGDLEILAIGSGAYHVDVPAWNNRLSFANARAFVRYVVEYLRDVSASLNLTVSAQSGSDVEAAALQIRLVDSVAYLNLGGLRSLLGDSRLDGWGGIELEALLRLMLDQDAQVFDAFMNGTDVAAVSPADTSTWLDLRRVKSAEPGIAIFETRLKLSDLLEDPAVAEAYRQQLGPGQSSAQVDMLIPLMQMIVGDSEIVMQQRIRLSDHYLQSVDLSYDHDLDRFTQGLLFPDVGTSQPLHVDFSYQLEYNHFDDAPLIAVPDDVLDILDYDGLRRLIVGGGSPL